MPYSSYAFLPKFEISLPGTYFPESILGLWFLVELLRSSMHFLKSLYRIKKELRRQLAYLS